MPRRSLFALLAFPVLLLALKSAPMPVPDGKAEHYGCVVDQIKAERGVLPGWMVHVWAEGSALAKRWVRLLSVRPEEQKAREKALRDCDRWMRLMEQRPREGPQQ
jgi:hypothetical protein